MSAKMNNSNEMSPFQEIMMAMKKSYRTFLEDCEALTKNQAYKEGICGTWSAKALVDHLTGWQILSPSFLKECLSSDNPVLDVDIDTINRISVEERQAWSWEESLAAFKESFDIFEHVLDEIPMIQIQTNAGIKSWVKAMNHEYQFHRDHIQKALER